MRDNDFNLPHVVDHRPRPPTAQRNDGDRWDPSELAGKVGSLFEGFPIAKEATNGMARLRYTMAQRA